MSKTLIVACFLAMTPAVWAATPAPAAHGDAHALRHITLSVPNMTCGLCPVTIRAALDKVPGVTQVRPDLDRKTVSVTYDPHKASVAALTAATADAGYPSRPLK
ncbi:cation transporter [Acidihalobacter prosperus]|uniref:HMA domain-containing protein n=1 Tax=Acidihalobacter prosperus TaxID=160660 RepID=A0A1A6C5C1_9GAMM|nr:cation transporter [Acidihalobacter prosperus]OBS09758.1 hypothetical protein Thpro_020808 [Acidihalobacter prosperus]